MTMLSKKIIRGGCSVHLKSFSESQRLKRNIKVSQGRKIRRPGWANSDKPSFSRQKNNRPAMTRLTEIKFMKALSMRQRNIRNPVF
jgi:hypothetical protein